MTTATITKKSKLIPKRPAILVGEYETEYHVKTGMKPNETMESFFVKQKMPQTAELFKVLRSI